MPKKPNVPDLNNLSEDERIKLEIAEEIGIYSKVMEKKLVEHLLALLKMHLK